MYLLSSCPKDSAEMFCDGGLSLGIVVNLDLAYSGEQETHISKEPQINRSGVQ